MVSGNSTSSCMGGVAAVSVSSNCQAPAWMRWPRIARRRLAVLSTTVIVMGAVILYLSTIRQSRSSPSYTLKSQEDMSVNSGRMIVKSSMARSFVTLLPVGILKFTTNSAGMDRLWVVAHQRERASVLRMQITWHGVSTMNSQNTVSNHCDEPGSIWIGPICPIRFVIMKAFQYSICRLTHPCQKLPRSRCLGVGQVALSLRMVRHSFRN